MVTIPPPRANAVAGLKTPVVGFTPGPDQVPPPTLALKATVPPVAQVKLGAVMMGTGALFCTVTVPEAVAELPQISETVTV